MTLSPQRTSQPASPLIARAGVPLAAAMVLAPICLLIGTALVPAALGERHGTDRAKALGILVDVAPDRARIPWAVAVIAVGLGLTVVAALALSVLGDGGRLSVIGVLLVAVGAPAGAASNAASSMNVYRLTDGDLSRSRASEVLAWSSGGAGAAMFVLYLLVLVGLVCLAAAAWRSGALSWWGALLVAVGALLGFGAPEGLTGALFTLPLVAGMVVAAPALLVRSR